MAKWSLKSILEHYTAVAKGQKQVKANSKYSEAEQRAYARGQMDARNQSKRLFAFSNATPEQRQAYKAQRKARKKDFFKD